MATSEVSWELDEYLNGIAPSLPAQRALGFLIDNATAVLSIYEGAFPNDAYDAPRRLIAAANSFVRGRMSEMEWRKHSINFCMPVRRNYAHSYPRSGYSTRGIYAAMAATRIPELLTIHAVRDSRRAVYWSTGSYEATDDHLRRLRERLEYWKDERSPVPLPMPDVDFGRLAFNWNHESPWLT